MRVLVIGAGYIGLPLAETLVSQGHSVFALRRSPPPATGTARVQWLSADLTDLASLQRLPRHYDWVVNCVASSHGGIEDYRRVYLEGTRNVLSWLGQMPPRKYVYTSSTSVYGQNDGSLVTEQSPTEPGAETSRVLLETEQLLRDAAEKGFPAVILRVAGIYGPGRVYWLKQFLAGEARIEGTEGRWLNMIHRDDLIGAITAALERGQPGQTYNVVDNEPVTQRTIFGWLAEKLSRPIPPNVPEQAATNRKRGLTNKRISNKRLRTELGWVPRFPTFREGFDLPESEATP